MSSRITRSSEPAISVHGWLDENLKIESLKHRFAPISRDDLAKILSRFYDLYFFGTIRQKDNLLATVCDAVAIAETAMGPIWQTKDESSDESFFYKRNESTDQELTGAVSGENANATDKQVMKTNFKTEVTANIQKIKNSETITENEKKFKMMTGFLALTFWSAATMDENQMNEMFSEEEYRQDLTTLAGWAAEKPWSPPCADCIKKIVIKLRKGLANTSIFFIIVCSKFVFKQTGYGTDSIVAEYLNKSVLTHTAMNGLDLIKMVEQACSILHIDRKTLRYYTDIGATASAWKTLTEFFSTYLSEENPEYGYKWARIIMENFRLDITPEENIVLTTMLAGIIEQNQGEGIWRAAWFNDHQQSTWFGLVSEYGNKLYELFELRSRISKNLTSTA